MTIKDIARLSGVGVSTVSRVLNDRPDVSEESRRRVLQVIAEYNYLPNNSARSLVRTKSDAVGLVVRGVQNPFYTGIIRAIERDLDAADCTMVMRQIGSCEDEIKCGAMMEREKRLQGIISSAAGRITARRIRPCSMFPLSAAPIPIPMGPWIPQNTPPSPLLMSRRPTAP